MANTDSRDSTTSWRHHGVDHGLPLHGASRFLYALSCSALGSEPGVCNDSYQTLKMITMMLIAIEHTVDEQVGDLFEDAFGCKVYDAVTCVTRGAHH